MKKIRTKNEPHKIIEVEEGELVDLERMGLIHEVIEDRPKPVPPAQPANAPESENKPAKGNK